MIKKAYLLVLLTFLVHSLLAQKIKYSDDFLSKLEKTELDIFTPTEGKYKSRHPVSNDYQKIDHVIFSKQEGLEIRYAVIPFKENNILTQVPNIDFMRTVSSTATNEEDKSTISIHHIEEAVLKDKFNANWGSVAYFQPKQSFARFEHCRLLSLYKEGKGMVYVFFLFDDASRFLDNRLHSLRFRTEI